MRHRTVRHGLERPGLTPPALKRLWGVLAAVPLLVLIAGCSTVTLTPIDPTSAPPESPEPEKPITFEFVPPTSCDQLVGDELGLELQAEGYEVFSDSNGGGLHPSAPIGQTLGTPFACLYGIDDGGGTVEISAQPLTVQLHDSVIADLATRGYDEKVTPAYTSFTQLGVDRTDDGASDGATDGAADGAATEPDGAADPDDPAEPDGTADPNGAADPDGAAGPDAQADVLAAAAVAIDGASSDATILHQVFADGWITVYRSLGGQDSLDAALDEAFAVGANVYQQQ